MLRMGGSIPVFPALLAIAGLILLGGGWIDNVGADKGSKGSERGHKIHKRDAYGYGSYTPPSSAYPAPSAYPTYMAPAPAAYPSSYAAPPPVYAAPAPAPYPMYAAPAPYAMPYYSYPSYSPPSPSYSNSNYNSSSSYDPCQYCSRCTGAGSGGQTQQPECTSTTTVPQGGCLCTKTNHPKGCTVQDCKQGDTPGTPPEFTCLCPGTTPTPPNCVRKPGGAAPCTMENQNTETSPCSCTKDKNPSGCQLQTCKAGDTPGTPPSNSFTCVCDSSNANTNPAGCVSTTQSVLVLNNAADVLGLAKLHGTEGSKEPLTLNALGKNVMGSPSAAAVADVLPNQAGLSGDSSPLSTLLGSPGLLDGVLGGSSSPLDTLPTETLSGGSNPLETLPVGALSGSSNPLDTLPVGALSGSSSPATSLLRLVAL